jgi:hypothetical protein
MLWDLTWTNNRNLTSIIIVIALLTLVITKIIITTPINLVVTIITLIP